MIKAEIGTKNRSNEHSILNIIISLLLVLRPQQWTKNLIIFAALIFSNNLFQVNKLLYVVDGFICFCLLSGCVYIINDIIDIEKDKVHPQKCNRPLAAGKISIFQAISFLFFLSFFSFYLSFNLNKFFGFIGIIYFSLVCLYSLRIKNIVILDVMIIALGFVLRTIAGAVVINVKVSPWLLMCTFLLSLFLALNKRKSEIQLMKIGAKSHRAILEEYTVEMINQMISIVTASTLMAYSLYTFTASKSIYLMGTIPFVIYGIFRYLYIVNRSNRGGTPELIILTDKPLMIDILLWVVTCISIIYWL